MKETGAPTLKDLQLWMRWVITDPRGVSSALTEAPDAHVSNRERYLAPAIDCSQLIQELPPITRIDRLNIYAEAYFSRLLESLSADYSIVLKAIGENAFSKLVADYLKAFPSSETNIGEVGKNFESFVSQHEYSKEVVFLPDIALLEWKVIESFYADDLPQLDAKVLSEIPGDAWPEARFVLDPSVSLLQTNWPVHELWNAGDAFELDSKLSFMRVYRVAGSVRVEGMDATEFKILSWMKEDLSLAQICEKLVEDQTELPPLMQWFQNWIALGVIRKILT